MGSYGGRHKRRTGSQPTRNIYDDVTFLDNVAQSNYYSYFSDSDDGTSFRNHISNVRLAMEYTFSYSNDPLHLNSFINNLEDMLTLMDHSAHREPNAEERAMDPYQYDGSTTEWNLTPPFMQNASESDVMAIVRELGALFTTRYNSATVNEASDWPDSPIYGYGEW